MILAVFKNKITLLVFTIFLLINLSNAKCNTMLPDSLRAIKFSYKTLIIPSVLITYGVIGLESDGLKIYNNELVEEVNENIDSKLIIDDYLQYAPMVATYGLYAFGKKGRNCFLDKTIILSTSYIIMGATVYGVKKWTKVERPDKTSKDAFPSGHTATAFMGATFLYNEYKDESIWYGISGYLVAGSIGAFRVYNNRHWLTDVIAGAGFGILSTEIAYWIHPYIKNKLFKHKKTNVLSEIYPLIDKNQVGINLSFTF